MRRAPLNRLPNKRLAERECHESRWLVGPWSLCAGDQRRPALRRGAAAVSGLVQRPGPVRLGECEYRRDTWTVRDGLLVCSGHPIGVMRTDRQYENFLLHIEWRHMEPGGNSGVFAWSDGTVPEGRRLPKGLEVQMLELDWVNLHTMKTASRRRSPTCTASCSAPAG